MHNSDLNPVRNEISNGIKKKIMKRIYTIWFFRKMTNPVFVETFAFVAIIFIASFYISFFDATRNAFSSSDSFFSVSRYFLNSFLITDSISQLFLIAMTIMIFILGRELFKKRSSAFI